MQEIQITIRLFSFTIFEVLGMHFVDLVKCIVLTLALKPEMPHYRNDCYYYYYYCDKKKQVLT